jgi:Spy/CpxP family protein refolding chaperone
MEIDTFLTFDKEFMYQPPLFTAKNDNQELGLAFILKSMTNNQRKIIRIIAKYQMENLHEKNGIKMKELLELSVE